VLEVLEAQRAELRILPLFRAVDQAWPSAQACYPSPACFEIDMLPRLRLLVNEDSSVWVVANCQAPFQAA